MLYRYIDVSFLESIKFPYLGILRDFGSRNFVTLHRDAYVDIVEVFYDNTKNTFNGRKFDKRFKTNICGKMFKVNTSLIYNLFEILKKGKGY